ncbi:hypothetical protein Tco_0012050 [Tanacetum coccineum]
MLILAVQQKLFHLNDNDIVDFIVALRMFTRSLVIKFRVEDLQLGVESYQKKLNITAPQQTFLEIEFKELYTPSYKPLGFLDGTLKKVRDEVHHRILDFHLGYNYEMSRRKWTAIDKKRSELMVELIDKQMRERRIIRNLERLVGARELEMDYKLMTHTVYIENGVSLVEKQIMEVSLAKGKGVLIEEIVEDDDVEGTPI